MDEVQGLEFTARRLGVLQALEEKRPTEEIQELCREGRVVVDYAATVLGGAE